MLLVKYITKLMVVDVFMAHEPRMYNDVLQPQKTSMISKDDWQAVS